MQERFQLKMDQFLPLRDVVFNTLRQAILTGELKPGERLMEIHLADQLGVSRTPIREAIRKLELEGLVTMIPRRGAEVAQITEKSMNDVLEVRRAVDALCVELACERITEEELQRLSEACDAFAEEAKKSEKEKDVKLLAQKDVALHDIIVQESVVMVCFQTERHGQDHLYIVAVEIVGHKHQYGPYPLAAQRQFVAHRFI